MDSSFTNIDFKIKFDKNVKKSIEFVNRTFSGKKYIFIDTSERSLNLMTENTPYMDLKDWHLPFPSVVLVTSGVIINLFKNGDYSNDKFMEFIITVTNTRYYLYGSVEIHKKEINPLDTPVIKKHLQISLDLTSGWSITAVLKVIHNGKDLIHGYYAKQEDKTTSLVNLFSFIHYFYPFSVDKELFIVESQACNKKYKKGKMQYSMEIFPQKESFYHIIHVKKILKRFIPTGDQSRQPLIKGHPRRAHKREYRNSRWTNMHGRSIIVKSTWVGPKTALLDGRLYKVHTDII
jgi:hypothetical protein